MLLTSCKDVEHCPSDTYCDPVELVCRPCIQCVDLKRLQPPTSAPAACITSVAECGSCFTGLLEDKQSLTMACVSPPAAGAWDEWLISLAALHLLALLLCICAALVLRNFRAYKLRASTHAHALCETRVESGTVPPPSTPPPYCPTRFVVPSHHMENEGTSSPLINDVPSLHPEATAFCAGIPASSGNQKETAQIQCARVFNDPEYQSLITRDENAVIERLQRDPEIQNTSDVTLPGRPNATDKRSKKLRVRQDSNNDSEDSGYAEPHGGAGSAGGATFTATNSIPFFINIFKNFTTVPQDDESVF